MKNYIWHSEVNKFFGQKLVFLRVQCEEDADGVEAYARQIIETISGVPKNGYCVYRYKENCQNLLFRVWVHEAVVPILKNHIEEAELNFSIFVAKNYSVSWESEDALLPEDRDQFIEEIEIIQFAWGRDKKLQDRDLVEQKFVKQGLLKIHEAEADDDTVKVFYIVHTTEEYESLAWEKVQELERNCGHHGFSELSLYQCEGGHLIVKGVTSGQIKPIEAFQDLLCEIITGEPPITVERDVCSSRARVEEGSMIGAVSLNRMKLGVVNVGKVLETLDELSSAEMHHDIPEVKLISRMILNARQNLASSDFELHRDSIAGFFRAILVTKDDQTELMIRANSAIYPIIARCELEIRGTLLRRVTEFGEEVLKGQKSQDLAAHFSSILNDRFGSKTAKYSIFDLNKIALGSSIQLLSIALRGEADTTGKDLSKTVFSRRAMESAASLRNKVMHCDNLASYNYLKWENIMKSLIDIILINQYCENEFLERFDLLKILPCANLNS